MSMQDIQSLSKRILAFSDLTEEEQEISPESEALFNTVTGDLFNKGIDVMRQFNADPNASEMEVRDNALAVITSTAAQYSVNPFILMDGGRTLYAIVHSVLGALVEAGVVSIPARTVVDADTVTTPNAGE